ncbi:zinc ribbon domain-containing protein [Streptomyces sp. NPDC001774]
MGTTLSPSGEIQRASLRRRSSPPLNAPAAVSPWKTSRGIHSRVRLRKDQPTSLHSRSFHQPAAFTAYKAKRAEVPLVHANPAYASHPCSPCGHTERLMSATVEMRATDSGSKEGRWAVS